jgi:hypothetical protein
MVVKLSQLFAAMAIVPSEKAREVNVFGILAV